jgi:hypothetical protein
MNGYIYKIVSNKTDKIYIGSTTKKLKERFRGHKKHLKDNTGVTSKQIMKYDDARIELIETMIFNNRSELSKREGYYIKLHKDKCVNKMVAGRTEKEYYLDTLEHIKQYYNDNIEHIKENQNAIEICALCDGTYTRRNKARHYKKYCINKSIDLLYAD